MNPNRNGKIARLPETVRNELNRRLHAGERGEPLIVWLNDLPEVRQMLNKRFHGKPVNAANLSEWRNGGYRDWRLDHEPKPPPRREWLARQHQWQPQPCQQQQAQPPPEPPATEDHPDDEAREGSKEFLDPADISDGLARRLGLELTQFADTWLAGARNPRERWRRLRDLLGALAQLRRGDHHAARVDMAQDRWQAEVSQRDVAQLEKDEKEYKEIKLGRYRAASQLPFTAQMHGGGEMGWKLAAEMLEIQFDLDPGTLLRPGVEPWRKDWKAGQKPEAADEAPALSPKKPHRQKLNRKPQSQNRKKQPRTRKPHARHRRRKATHIQLQVEEVRPEVSPDSSQNPGDSEPIQTDSGDLPGDFNPLKPI